MLLRFRTANHGSLREPAELSMAAASARGAMPADKDWIGFTTRVAGIYGANASGKSTVLNALRFMVDAITWSATRWGERQRFPHAPFLLDDESRNQRSSYEIDFVVNGVRYNYGFDSDAEGVHEEWLYSFPHGRGRMLFERTGAENPEFSFGRSLGGPNATLGKLVAPTALFLSVAANHHHPALCGIHQTLRDMEFRDARDFRDHRSRFAWLKHAVSML